MRLILVIAAALALSAAPAQAVVKPPASVSLVSCENGLEAADRTATFEGTMRAVKGATRLQMRFALHSRADSARRWTRVAAPGWGTWVTADPGVTRYVYTKEVAGLAVDASYRTVVRFRWRDALGRTLARRIAISPRCAQPDLRPNLVPRDLQVLAGPDEGSRRYVVTVRNTGRTATGSFDLVLSVDGVEQPAVAVLGLEPGERRLVEIVAPRCTVGAGGVVVLVDTGDAVAERYELDNRLRRACVDAR